jgi:hypothetical protein
MFTICIMGLFNTDDYTLNNGVTISNMYVIIDNIKIRKSNVEDFKYTVEADKLCFASKDVRLQNITTWAENTLVVVSTDTLDNLHEQVYTEVKKNFENYTDDL